MGAGLVRKLLFRGLGDGYLSGVEARVFWSVGSRRRTTLGGDSSETLTVCLCP